MFQKVVVIDAKGHLLGRLASVIAKEILNGQRIVVVRTEEINISGSLFRNKVLFARYLRKRTNTNPTHGPWHYRAPSRQLWRVVRGMLPHKTERGKAALERLKVYEGVPHPFNKLKRQVVPLALKNLRLKPHRKFCKLGDLASQVGWKHQGLIERLENKRKIASKAYYQTKKQLSVLRTKAVSNVSKSIDAITPQLAKFGY